MTNGAVLSQTSFLTYCGIFSRGHFADLLCKITTNGFVDMLLNVATKKVLFITNCGMSPRTNFVISSGNTVMNNVGVVDRLWWSTVEYCRE